MTQRHRHKTRQEMQDDARVEEAIAESFPASDAPSYNRGVEPKFTLGSTTGGDKLMRQDEEKKGSFGYLIGGFALGTVVGLLMAPKKGSELMEDITDWGRDKKEKGQELYSRAKEYIPHRMKRGVSESVES